MSTSPGKSSAKADRDILWQDELRKMGGDELVRVLKEIRECQQKTWDRVNEVEGNIEISLKAHINTAFAGGDADGHRRAHEVMISMMEERRRMYASIKEKTVSGLIWGGLVWLGYSILTSIRIKLGLPP